MKLFIVGSTGPTGLLLVSQALDKGHHVVTVVRSPEKMTVEHDNLKVTKGSVLKASDMLEPMRGCDAVVSAIGGKNGTFNPCSIYTESGRAIAEAMREAKVTRLVVCTAWATKDDPQLPIMWRIIKKTMIRNVLKDMSDFEDYLTEECKDLNITVVRPGMLTDGPLSDKPSTTEDGGYCIPGSWIAGGSISRADVARFMLACLDETTYDGKSVAII